MADRAVQGYKSTHGVSQQSDGWKLQVIDQFDAVIGHMLNMGFRHPGGCVLPVPLLSRVITRKCRGKAFHYGLPTLGFTGKARDQQEWLPFPMAFIVQVNTIDICAGHLATTPAIGGQGMLFHALWCNVARLALPDQKNSNIEGM